jgi:hypothetical protein
MVEKKLAAPFLGLEKFPAFASLISLIAFFRESYS